jgi:murein DD-endopeptidase MepM/ murein hydrolase activator NlpD
MVSESLPARPRPNVARVEPAPRALAVTPVSAPTPVAAPKVTPEPAPAVAAVAPAAPQSGTHRVAKGEHLGAIAGRYGVSLQAIAKANGLSSPYLISVGQVLQVPGGADVAQRQYVVRRGDTLSAVARRFDVAQANIAAANGIKSPYALRVGQSLEIPGVQTARAVPDAAPPPLTGSGFLWPVSGKVIGGFGVAGNGQRRNGINIAARKGTPVVASEDGVVVYASDGIDGYGRMVLVRHAEGYITTYAHNASLVVDVGDVVRRGEVIARVGDTGDVSQSQLHFELRRGTKPINPESVLVRDPTAVASM